MRQLKIFLQERRVPGANRGETPLLQQAFLQ
jgi:tRNA(Ile)-lysidine synthetase-like protein